MGDDPCLAKASSLGEAWELTEACLLERNGLRIWLQTAGIFAVASLGALAGLAGLGAYSQRLAQSGRATPHAVQWLLHLVRLALYGVAAYAIVSVTGVLELGPLAAVGRQLEAMLLAA